MKGKLRSTVFITAFGFVGLTVVGAGLYVWRSRNSPYVLEIVFGSIMVSLLLGVISKCMDRLLDRAVATKPAACMIGVCICLLVLISVLVYLANMPKKIRREIPVVYLANSQTMELASDLAFDSDAALISYMETCLIFKHFREQSPNNAEAVKEMLTTSMPGKAMFRFRCFQNLTEYLVVYLMSSNYSIKGVERVAYWREVHDFLGLPDKRIRGKAISIESISGDLKENLFYRIRGNLPGVDAIELTLPKGSKVCLARKDGLTSEFVIKNDYVRIVIGVRCVVSESQGMAYVDDSGVLPRRNGVIGAFGPFEKFTTMIYYEATFSKWRYAFPEMQYYEKWANSVVDALERKFAWGSPPLLDSAGILRREARSRNPEN